LLFKKKKKKKRPKDQCESTKVTQHKIRFQIGYTGDESQKRKNYDLKKEKRKI